MGEDWRGIAETNLVDARNHFDWELEIVAAREMQTESNPQLTRGGNVWERNGKREMFARKRRANWFFAMDGRMAAAGNAIGILHCPPSERLGKLGIFGHKWQLWDNCPVAFAIKMLQIASQRTNSLTHGVGPMMRRERQSKTMILESLLACKKSTRSLRVEQLKRVKNNVVWLVESRLLWKRRP